MEKRTLLESCDLFLLDLDGTVYLDETPIGAMCETLDRLRGMGKQLVYLTNNSSKTEAEYREKLGRIGLLDRRDGIYTSGMATAEYLNEHFCGKKVCLLATAAVREEFLRYGVALDDEAPDVCVLAYDTELTFGGMRRFDRFLRAGLPFLATHPDDVCPTADGTMPDVGSFLALFERSSGRRPDAVIGKPYPEMGTRIARRYGVPAERTCMVGDRMHTDIRFAGNAGMLSVLVLSGETTRETMGRFPDVPSLVLGDLNELVG